VPAPAILAQNQVDSLPLITATDAAAPDAIFLVGQKITKLWTPTTTLINGSNYGADPDDAAGSALFTPFLDVRGCNEFVAIMVCTVPNIGSTESGVAQTLIIQYRTPGGIIQPHSGNPGAVVFSGAAGRTPEMILGTFPTDYIFTFGWANPGGAVTMSSDMRLWFRRTIGPRGQQAYKCWLYGAGS
jgi:hypothetical protein